MPIRRTFQWNTPNLGLVNDGHINSLYCDYHGRGTNYEEIAYFMDRDRPSGTYDVLELGDRLNYKGTSKQSLPIFPVGGQHAHGKTINAEYTATVDDYIIICQLSSNYPLHLPSIANYPHKMLVLKADNGANTCTVTPNGADKVDTFANWLLTARDSIEIYADPNSNNWWVLGQYT